MKITIEHYDKCISCSMPDGTEIGVALEVVRGLFVTAGWHNDTVESTIIEWGEELSSSRQTDSDND